MTFAKQLHLLAAMLSTFIVGFGIGMAWENTRRRPR